MAYMKPSRGRGGNRRGNRSDSCSRAPLYLGGQFYPNMGQTNSHGHNKPYRGHSVGPQHHHHYQRHSNQERTSPTADPSFNFPFLQKSETISYIQGSKVMFILRGLPGSGKTTLAKALKSKYPMAISHSSDDFFTKNGVYKWDGSRLTKAHQTCQYNVRQSATNSKKNIIIVDNTNVQMEHIDFYFKIAEENNYIVILIEPKTPWKFDTVQLAKRNIHNISIELLKRKMERWEQAIPIYFGWFLNEADSQMLKAIGQVYLEECLRLQEFNDDFQGIINRPSDFLKYFKCDKLNLHCTSYYCGRGEVYGSEEYCKQKHIKKSFGQVFTLHIIGFVVTPKSFGARIKLTRSQLDLWNQNDSEQPIPDIDGINQSMAQLHLQSDHGSQEFQPKSQNGFVCIPSLHWSLPPFDSPAQQFHPTQGKGSRAHITLGTAQGVGAVQTGFDLINVVRYETGNPNHGRRNFPVNKGKICNLGNRQWVVYLNKQIEVQALYSGLY